jgi:hypothetical protein
MHSGDEAMSGKEKDQAPAEPPGEGEGIEEASEEALRALKERDEGGENAGFGDIG